MSEQIKVIAVGDYVEDVDKIVPIPVMHEGVRCHIEVRIQKPMAEHSHRLMEMLSETFGDELESLSEMGEVTNAAALSKEDRRKVLMFSWLNTATLISSCTYHPTRDVEGNPVKNPKRVWETAEEVGQKCPKDLFEGLRTYIEGVGLDKTVREVESKKLPATP